MIPFSATGPDYDPRKRQQISTCLCIWRHAHVSSFNSFYTQVSRTWVSKEQFCPVIVYSGKHWLSPSHQVLQIRNVLESKEKVSCRKYWPAATSEQQRTINETAAPRPTCILTICFPICTNRSNPWTVWPLGRHSLVF